MRSFLLSAIIGLSLFNFLGCRDSKQASKKVATFTGQYQGKYPIRATVTVGMVADLVREIGGEQLEVTQLLGPTIDPHLYKPSRDDVNLLMKADIVFFNGLFLEGKMAETLQRLSEKKRSVAVAERLSAERLGNSVSGHEHPDPHVWMDVSLWSDVAQVVGDELCEYDPANKEDYLKRTQTLRAKLDSLHQYGVKQIASIPKDQRVLVTSHDAFRYFGRAYGIDVEAIQGISTESEAGLQRMNELVDEVRKIEPRFESKKIKKIPALCISPSVDIGEIARQKAHHMPRILRLSINAFGQLDEASEILSYLLFDKEFCRNLIDIGYNDALKQKTDIERFFHE